MKATLFAYENKISADYDKEIGVSAFVYIDSSNRSEENIENEVHKFEDYYNEAVRRIKKRRII